MSTTSSSEEKKEETPASPATTTAITTSLPIKDNGFLGLGIDLNNPFYALAAIAAGAAVGLAGLSIYNRFVVPRLAPIPPEKPPVAPPPVVTVPTPDELRMKERAAGVEGGRRKTAEEEYIESIRLNGIIEQQNQNLQSHNIHQSGNFYDQMYNVPPVRNPLHFPAEAVIDDEVTEVVDDFDPNYSPQREYQLQQLQQQARERPQQQVPKKMMTAVVDHHKRPPKPVMIEDTQAMSPEEIDSYDHVDIRQVPAEFVNVGNRPEPFENIQQVDHQHGGEGGDSSSNDDDDDPYDIGDMEIDADTLKVLETNAVASTGAPPPPAQKKK